MEIILYQAPSLIEKKSLISERRMALLRPDKIGTSEGQAGPVKLLSLKDTAVRRRMAGWAGLLSSFRQPKAVNGAGLLSSFPRLRQNPSFPRALAVNLGNFLIILAFVGLFLSLGPLIKLEIGYRFKKEENLQAENFPATSQGHFSDLISDSRLQGIALETQITKVPDVNFSLVIPKINASSVIIPNVNAANEKEYNAALKRGIAHAAGTVFPGMKGTIFLFAHSTDAPWNIRRYNAVFYLLRELKENDRITVYYQGVKHYYSVFDKKVVDPSETYWFNQQEEEVLVLQTCYPPGTTQKALLIFAKPIRFS